MRMQNQNQNQDEAEVAASISAIKGEEWGNCSSLEDALDQPSFQEDEAAKVPYVGDKVRANSNMLFISVAVQSTNAFGYILCRNLSLV